MLLAEEVGMSLSSVHSVVTNGELLYRVLFSLDVGMLGGDNEICTTSLEALEDRVCQYLRESRDIKVANLPDRAYLSPIVLRGALSTIVDVFKNVGILKDWSGEVVYNLKDPHRLYVAKSWKIHNVLRSFRTLVEAQWVRPEFTKSERSWGIPESLVANRVFLYKVLEVPGGDLGDFSTRLGYMLNSFEDKDILPRSASNQVLLATYQFVKMILRIRTQDITVPEVIHTVLRLQSTFVGGNALWWMYALNAFVLHSPRSLKREIEGRTGDVAANVFVSEAQRQVAVFKERRQFKKDTEGCLSGFVDFEWINAPFDGWNSHLLPSQEKVSVPVAIPSFEVASLDRGL